MAGCRPFTRLERTRIYDYLRESGRTGLRDATLHLLGCWSGFRVAELVRIQRWQLVDDAGGIMRTISIRGKGNKKRTVAVHTSAHGRLLEWLVAQQRSGYLHPEDYVFCTGKDRHLSPKQARDMLQHACRALGIRGESREIGTHSWRKTFAFEVYRRACELQTAGTSLNPIEVAQRALGHANPGTTTAYLADIMPMVHGIVEGLDIL